MSRSVHFPILIEGKELIISEKQPLYTGCTVTLSRRCLRACGASRYVNQSLKLEISKGSRTSPTQDGPQHWLQLEGKNEAVIFPEELIGRSIDR